MLQLVGKKTLVPRSLVQIRTGDSWAHDAWPFEPVRGLELNISELGFLSASCWTGVSITTHWPQQKGQNWNGPQERAISPFQTGPAPGIIEHKVALLWDSSFTKQTLIRETTVNGKQIYFKSARMNQGWQQHL